MANVYDTARPYAAAYVLLERAGKVLFVLRENTRWMNGYYGLPSGKVERGEGFLAAAVREAKEEVGVVIVPADLEHVISFWRHEADDPPDMEWCDVVFRAKAWQGEPYNAEPDMHSEAAWFALDALPQNTIPQTRDMIQAIVAGKNYGERGQKC